MPCRSADKWQARSRKKIIQAFQQQPPPPPPPIFMSFQGSLPNGRDGVGGRKQREGAQKRKLSPNCHISKAVPARLRFALFNLTHTASCLLKPCKAPWRSASRLEEHGAKREGGRRIHGGRRRQDSTCEEKRAFYLFFGANMQPLS